MFPSLAKCVVNKASQYVNAVYNGENHICIGNELLMVSDYIDTIGRYQPNGYFLYKEGCTYSLSYAVDPALTLPITLVSITIEEDDGSETEIELNLLVPTITVNLQDLADALNDAGCGTELSDISWAYNGGSETGTLEIRRSFKPILSALFEDSVEERFMIEFGDGSSCTLIQTTEPAGPNCDIDLNAIISNIKKLCTCCPQVAAAVPCTNLIPTLFDDGVPRACQNVNTATEWQAGLPGYLCTLSTNVNPINVAIVNCFEDDTFYWLKVYIENYSSGALQVKFDGSVLGTMSANGSQVFFFTPVGLAGTIDLQPINFTGCVKFEIYQSDPVWLNVTRSWIYDSDSGCFVHEPGAGGGDLIYNDTSLVRAGHRYRIKAQIGILAGGPLEVLIGGETFSVIASGLLDETFTASVDSELVFRPASTDDHVAICGIELCETAPAGAETVDQTAVILGTGVPDEYFDMNGNAIQIT